MIEDIKNRDRLRLMLTAMLLVMAICFLVPVAHGEGGDSVVDAAKVIPLTDSVKTGIQSQANIKETSPEVLIPMGRTVGVKLFSEGVMLVGISELNTSDGTYSPVEKAGLKKGDIITKVDGKSVDTIEDLTGIVKTCGGKAVPICAKRGQRQMEVYVTPACVSGEGVYKLGAWIRDSMAGIGTMTYYDPATKTFGALGHGVNDIDTSILIPLSFGAVMDSSVIAVKKGEAGSPGELQGSFNLTEDLGSIYANTDCGIFGSIEPDKLTLGTPVKVADKNEIRIGPASIISNIDDKDTAEYGIEIIKLYPSALGSQRNMMIKITDEKLLSSTGGIVQGMSGSPIMQNGKIVGAVTHVLVNDPTRGYGIFIGNMLREGFAQNDEIAS